MAKAPSGDGRLLALLAGAAALGIWLTALWLIFGDML
jgi:hypothetical protein